MPTKEQIMTARYSRRPKALLAMGVAMLMLMAGITASSPSSSQAYTVSNYCEGAVLTSYNYCQGGARNMYAVEGWGNEHSVCVFIGASYFYTCSGGPGQHIYDPFGGTVNAVPGIQPNTPATTTVHGRAYTA